MLLAAAAAASLAVPSGALAEASDGASCAGQFATFVPGGQVKGEFVSGNAQEDDPVFGNFGQATSTVFAQGPREACPF
jgi:hypothetical protein